MKKSKVNSVNITAVYSQETEIFYETNFKGINVEPYCKLDWDIRDKQLSYFRMNHFKAEYDAVGKFLCNNTFEDFFERRYPKDGE